MSATRWTSECTDCHRPDVEVESRESHGQRVLCDACAAKPYRWAVDDNEDDDDRGFEDHEENFDEAVPEDYGGTVFTFNGDGHRNGHKRRKVEPPIGPDWLKGAPMDPCAVEPDALDLLAGFPFLHAGMAALISGPTGGGRSSFIQACAYDAALKGQRVLYLGAEVTEDEFNARAAILAEKRGDDPAVVRERVALARYLDLTDTLAAAWKRPKRWIKDASAAFDVIIVDPLGDVLEALELEDKNSNYRRFYMRAIEPLRAHGTAVVLLDNVGHADDAQDRAIGPSAKRHKTDLEFACTAKDDPPALQMRCTKVRSVRAAIRKSDTWVCDEATLRVTTLNGPFKATPRRKSGQERKRDEREQLVQDALSANPQGARRIASITDIPKSTVQDLLDRLCVKGLAASTPTGWVTVRVSESLKEPGHPDTRPQNAIFDLEEDDR